MLSVNVIVGIGFLGAILLGITTCNALMKKELDGSKDD